MTDRSGSNFVLIACTGTPGATSSTARTAPGTSSQTSALLRMTTGDAPPSQEVMR